MKTMKSTMKTVAMMMMATLMTAGMASCSNDDDNAPVKIEKTTNSNVKIDAAETAITIMPTRDAKKIGETIFEYVDENGKLHSDTLTSADLDATLKVSKLPASIDLTIKQKAKAGASLPDRTTYTFGAMIVAKAKGMHGTVQPVGNMKQTHHSQLIKVSTDSVGIQFGEVTQIVKKTLVLTTEENGTQIVATLK